MITPEQSIERAREICRMPPGQAKHRCFDALVNEIARQHGHGQAVDLFEADADGSSYHKEKP